MTFDHEWEPPPDPWLDHTGWMPGWCAHFAEGALEPCGVHQLEHHSRPERLEDRCDRYGLPHDFDALMRHMDANRAMTEAALTKCVDILEKRLAKARDVVEAAKALHDEFESSETFPYEVSAAYYEAFDRLGAAVAAFLAATG